VILAAGKQASRPMAGPGLDARERSILAMRCDNALGVVRPEDIYIVVGYRQDDVYAHLGPKFNYVVQPSAGHRGMPCCRWPRCSGNFPGNLLILYGDTPLFRPDSIRGLLNRHQLKQAHLTLLTAMSIAPSPTGASSATPPARSSTSSNIPRPRPRCARFKS